MIKRIYCTEDECVEYYMEQFDRFPSYVIDTEELVSSFDWEYLGMESVYDDEEETYTYVSMPAWSTWFIPRDSCCRAFIEGNEEEVAKCGFTIIKHEGEFFALGVDGVGYSFKEAHFKPLYELEGLKWHDE